MALNLPSLQDRPRGGWPDTKATTRLEDRKADDAYEKREWARCQREVWKRDESKDRMTGKRVVKTLRLQANRGEVAHIVRRDDQAVRFDVRNLLLLAFETHQKLDHNELEVVGTKFFRKNGKRYIDATYPVTFRKPKAKR